MKLIRFCSFFFLVSVFPLFLISQLPVRAGTGSGTVLYPSVKKNETITFQRLPNGLELLILTDSTSPVVEAGMFFKAGPAYETATENGLCNTLEKMIFQVNSGGFDQLDETQEQGVQYALSSHTQNEKTGFTISMQPSQLKSGLTFLYDKIDRPQFNENNHQRAMRIIAQEFYLQSSDPFFVLVSELKNKLYGNNRHKKDLLGDFGTVLTVSENELLPVFHRHFVPNKCLIGISGMVNADSCIRWVKEIFGSWPSVNQSEFVEKDKETGAVITDGFFMMESDKLKSALMVKAWSGPGTKNNLKDCIVGDVFTQLVTQPSGNFIRNIIEKGQAKWVELRFKITLLDEPLELVMIPFDGLERQCLQKVTEEVSRFTEPDYFNPMELEIIKQKMIYNQTFIKDNSGLFLRSLSDFWSLGEYDDFYQFESIVRSLNMEDIREFVGKYIYNQPAMVGVAYHPEQRESMKEANLFESVSLQNTDINDQIEPKLDLPPSFTVKNTDEYEEMDIPSLRIYFEPKSFWPDSTSITLLKKLSRFLKSHLEYDIHVDGHADTAGKESTNLSLSKKRAESIKNYLIEQGGIHPERMVVRGFGEKYPEFPEADGNPNPKNRRVVFSLISARK